MKAFILFNRNTLPVPVDQFPLPRLFNARSAILKLTGEVVLKGNPWLAIFVNVTPLAP